LNNEIKDLIRGECRPEDSLVNLRNELGALGTGLKFLEQLIYLGEQKSPGASEAACTGVHNDC